MGLPLLHADPSFYVYLAPAVFAVVLFPSPPASAAADYRSYVYKGCAVQQFQDPSQPSSQALRPLLDSLTAQSSRTIFASGTGGEGQSAILGLYQCRGDLGNGDCRGCVGRASNMFDEMCGRAVAARIQLRGCYVSYQVSGFQNVSGTLLLYRRCGSSGAGFAGDRDAAFQAAEVGIQGGGGRGFYAANVGSAHAFGQCEGDLASGDCVECVKTALERARDLCESSASGEVYLQRCFVGYSSNREPLQAPSGKKKNTERTVAIAVGGTAALGFVAVCLMCARSVLKRKH